jgi:hypothetical protein
MWPDTDPADEPDRSILLRDRTDATLCVAPLRRAEIRTSLGATAVGPQLWGRRDSNPH